MANSDGTDWDAASPADSALVSAYPAETRALRSAVKIRNDKEHAALATASAGGEHKAGSAKGYYQASAPTQRPDAATSLDSNDNGRIWVDSDDASIYMYIHPTWTQLTRVPVKRAVFQQEVSGGSGAGATSAGAWVTRILNATQTADTSFATINTGTGVITLAVGTYHIRGFATARALEFHHLRLRRTNNTAADVLYGTPVSLYAPTSQSTQTTQCVMNIDGVITVTVAGSTFELQHWATEAASNGQGITPANSVTNVCALVEIEKIP